MAQIPNPKHDAAIIAALERDVVHLEGRVQDAQAELERARDALKACKRRAASAAQDGNEGMGERRKKGENKRLLLDLYRAAPDKSYTVSELAKALSVPATSLQNVLNRSTDEFEQDGDSRWKWKGESTV